MANLNLPGQIGLTVEPPLEAGWRQGPEKPEEEHYNKSGQCNQDIPGGPHFYNRLAIMEAPIPRPRNPGTLLIRESNLLNVITA